MALSDYHQFAIPTAVKEAEMGIAFSELENDMGDAFYAQVLYGSENGQRFWRLTLPTLTGSSMDSRTVTGINGETLTYEEYIWDLFCTHKADGTAFAYQDLRTGQYYLCRFANKELTYSRMLTKLYSTGLELKQWRIPGETVFYPADLRQTWGSYNPEEFPDFDGFWSPEANNIDSQQAPQVLIPTGDVVSTTSGSRKIVRLSATTNDGVLVGDSGSVVLFDIILLMKMRESTFSNNAGIVTGGAAPNNAALVGASGTTKFFDFGFGSGYTYKLDGVQYAENNQQAPMNTWGIVHARWQSGVTLTDLQFGADRDFSGRFAEVDYGYTIFSYTPFPTSTVREIMEFLSVLKTKLA